MNIRDRLMYLAVLDGYNGFINDPNYEVSPGDKYIPAVAKYSPYKINVIGEWHELPDYFNALNVSHRVAHKLDKVKQKRA